MTKIKSTSSRVPSPITSKPTLMIGSSILRNIKSSDSGKLKVQSISGAKFNDIKSTLFKKHSNEESFSEIILVAGTNDCACSEKTSEDILDDLIETVTEAKKISPVVTISSITLRTDDGPAQLKAENLNILIKQYTNQTQDVQFIDNGDSFRLADKSPNDGYLIDGHHLSYSGSERLIKNLKIPANVQRGPRQPRNVSYQSIGNQWRSPRPSYRGNAAWSDPLCVFCNMRGHDTSSCRRRNIRCYSCNRLGHTQVNCSYT